MKKKYLYKSGKNFFVIVFALIIIQLIVYKPIKFANVGTYVKNPDYYIVCEYVEVTGFDWKILYDKSGKISNTYVELDSDEFMIDMFFSDQLLYGQNKFVFYGDFIENKSIVFESQIDADYLTFKIKDWDILAPVSRLSLGDWYEPKLYLYKEDFEDN